MNEAICLVYPNDRRQDVSTAASQVFEIVVSDILAGILRPGDRLSERDLVLRFKLSRTPVREAIKRLFERGFVEAGPKGVAVIAVFNDEELRDLYSLRVQMESYAAPLPEHYGGLVH